MEFGPGWLSPRRWGVSKRGHGGDSKGLEVLVRRGGRQGVLGARRASRISSIISRRRVRDGPHRLGSESRVSFLCHPFSTERFAKVASALSSVCTSARDGRLTEIDIEAHDNHT